MTEDADLRKKDLAYWRERLTPDQFQITREGGTERAFTGKYNGHKADGFYHCSNCEVPLFSSETKYDSGSGWPSFWRAVDDAAIECITDRLHGMVRIEVRCNRCGAHLGHVFDDGPTPTGQRFCINSASLVHEKDRDKS